MAKEFSGIENFNIPRSGIDIERNPKQWAIQLINNFLKLDPKFILNGNGPTGELATGGG